jgi:TRAP-type C4-dicarboxylate transport system permease small subunit
LGGGGQLLSIYAKLELVLSKIEKAIITLMMVLMFICVSLQVITRFFNLPIPDTSDISLVAFAVMTFIGAGLLVYTKGHITLEVSTLIKSKKIVFIFELLTNISLLIIIGVLLNIGFSLLTFALEGREATMALRIPMAIPFSALVIGLVLMTVHTIGIIIKLFSKVVFTESK